MPDGIGQGDNYLDNYRDLGQYIEKLTASLIQVHGQRKIKVSIDAKDLSVGIDQAVPCGLVINEIVANSLKHAFKEGRPG